MNGGDGGVGLGLCPGWNFSFVIWFHAPFLSDIDPVPTPQAFYTFFYNHAHRPHFEKLLYVGLSRSPNGHFKPLLDPGGRFISETAARWFQK
jgi:hypothetical protein